MALKQPLNDVKELASNETSCIKKTQGDVVLCLHPIYAADAIKGVTAELDSMSSRYSKLLGGIPMAYEKVGIAPTGGLVHTSPFMHVRVHATFYVFQPQVGSVMEGTVIRKSLNHLSCLVHKMFNVSVPRPQNVFAENWAGTLKEEGDSVRIIITDVDMSFFLPMIIGRIDSDSVEAEEGQASQAATISEDQVRNASVDSGISSDEKYKLESEVKKKKGHKQGDVKVLAKKKGVKDIGKAKEKEKKKGGKKRDVVIKTEKGLEVEFKIKKEKVSDNNDVEVKKEKKKKKKEKMEMKYDKVKVKTEYGEKDVKIKIHKSKKDHKVRKGKKKKKEKERKKSSSKKSNKKKKEKQKNSSKKEKKLKIKSEVKVKTEMPSSTTQVTSPVTPSKHSIKSKKRKAEESPGKERKKKIKLEPESP